VQNWPFNSSEPKVNSQAMTFKNGGNSRTILESTSQNNRIDLD
jgi:hypothetical protein